jgi:hypothetical protein
MPRAGFETAIPPTKRQQTYALDRALNPERNIMHTNCPNLCYAQNEHHATGRQSWYILISYHQQYQHNCFVIFSDRKNTSTS